MLAGAGPEMILKCAREMLGRSNKWGNPFGGGRAAESIVEICCNNPDS